MHAAVVTAFDAPPSYQEFPEPTAGPGEEVLDVLACGLHPRVRSQANGSHYTSTDELPLIPGIDGVGRQADGTLVYFVLPDTPRGSMAQRVAVDSRRCVVLPAGCDPVTTAAAMNPAMSSWVALRRRVRVQPGQRVMVLGATGSAGRMAVQVCKLLGAGHVTAVGRRATKLAALPALGADALVDLSSDTCAADLAAAGSDVDVVLDYLWGQPAVDVLRAIVPHRSDDDQQLTWVQIGSVADREAPVPSAALRATRLSLVGSGQGSVPTRAIVAELPALAHEIAAGAFAVNARAIPLTDVQAAWAEAATTPDRLVLIPGPRQSDEYAA